MPNRLASESSPYLRQHAGNPVDWHPWGPEALGEAARRDVPILLSVGYSACHWCHVMEHESFADADTAAAMNADFVNIKVDREERPDLDAVYMAATQALTGRGGWPMTVFLTPDGAPFYAGTYFPPEDRHGMPAFRRVLASVARAWAERRDELTRTGASLAAELGRQMAPAPAAGLVSEATLDAALRDCAARYDATWGGFGGAPKFPQAMTIALLLRLAARRTGEDAEVARAMAEHTLAGMARGGMYDQLGGGFHRYSVDAQWRVPHFEKMLYDNALLARVYTEAYQATGNVMFEVVATETLDWAVREMTSPEGAFYAAQDADSEGEEGAFFTWTPAQLEAALGAEDAHLFAAVFDVRDPGVLWLPATLSEVGKRVGASAERLGEVVSRGRRVLFEAREARPKPFRDEKALAGWNGLMLAAFATAAAAFDRPDYLAVARANGDFLLTALSPDGPLRHVWTAGVAKGEAFLEDHANVIDGLLALHAASLEARWLEAALDLADAMVDRFWDADAGAFYDTSAGHEALVARPRDVFDNAVPAGNSVAADVLARLARLTGDGRWRAIAEAAVESVGEVAARHPTGFGRLLCAVDGLLAPGAEAVLVGAPDAPTMRPLRLAAAHGFTPHLIVAGGAPADVARLAGRVGAFRAKAAETPRAWVCRGAVCALPTDDPQALSRLLAE